MTTPDLAHVRSRFPALAREVDERPAVFVDAPGGSQVPEPVIEAMAAERFLILSHPQVHEYMQRKASGVDRWLAGMRRLRDKTYGAKI